MGAHISEARPGAREVLDALRRIVRALRESSRWAEREVGLSGAQLFVLETLSSEPALSLNELAERTRTHQSSVSTVVARLVRRGLIRRVHSVVDGRRLELTLSAEGRRVAGRAPDVAQQRLVRAVDRLPAATRHALAQGLGELARGVDRGRRSPPMFFDTTHQKGRRLREH